MKGLMVHLAAALLGILILAQAHFAWKPQGRFGKRTLGEENNAVLPSTGGYWQSIGKLKCRHTGWGLKPKVTCMESPS